MRPVTRCTTLSVACMLLSSVALAGPLPDRFTLGRYIPGDVWLYVHGVHNPERAWLDAEWAEVLDALKESGIDRDITNLLASVLGDEDRPKAERLLQLFQDVRWADLVVNGEEFAIGERLTLGVIPYEYFFLSRGKANTAEANIAGLVAILTELASWSDEICLTKRKLSGVIVWSLRSSQPKSSEQKFSIDLFRKGDIIGLAFGLDAAKSVVDLMTGKAQKPPVAESERFKTALGEVKAPKDNVMFFDARSLFAGIDHLFLERAVTESQANGDENELEVVHTIRKALDRCNLWDYTIVTMETEGRRELTHTVALLRRDKRECGLVRAFFERKPFERFDRFVPVDATGFSVNAMFDLEQVYKLVMDFVEKDLPEGAKHIAWWNKKLASIGFDLYPDLFSWWSGEMISVTLPPAGVTPMGGADWVLIFRVKNGELALQKINVATEFIRDKLQARGQPLMISPAPVSAEGFHQITHPMFAMFMRPVIGVKDEWLIIGSSPVAINKCLDVASGKAPSIVENQRFKKEGLIPKGPVSSVSFKDISRQGEEAAMLLGMLSMGIGVFSASLPDEPQTREIKRVLGKFTPIVMKLGPVLRKIDFYSSQSRTTTFDGSLTLRTEAIITYKPPLPQDINKAGAK